MVKENKFTRFGNFNPKKVIFSLIPVIVLIAFSFWAGKGLFKYNIYSAHDMIHHISRGFDAMHTLQEGHFPLRWAGSLNYKCGVAVYNFFYPLIYYLIGVMGIVSGGYQKQKLKFIILYPQLTCLKHRYF